MVYNVNIVLICKRVNYMLMNIVELNYTEDFGKIDVEPLRNLNKFSLMIKTPYVHLERWFNISRLRVVCKEVIAPKYCPFTHDETPIYRFCMENKIPFKGISLKNTITNKYIMIDNCVFVNLARINEYPRLLLVYIPIDKNVVIFENNESIIGLSTNTIDLSEVSRLKISGDLFGSFKYDFSRLCNVRNNTISYPKIKAFNNDFVQIPQRDFSHV